jgi:23S rRNA pseudouridine1911/1915/1917 synthase
MVGEMDKSELLEIPPDCAGQRLDQALTGLFPDYSRAQIQQWIRDGRVRLNDAPLRGRDKVKGGERISVSVPEAVEAPWQAQDIPLEILFEDEEMLVINKPAGLVVHPGAGNAEGTLLNALIHYAPELKTLARAGIVHRLDKETSGLLVVARTDRARLSLIEQLQERSVAREYLAVVCGVLVSGGTVDAPIGRHPTQRTRMAVTSQGRPAVSHYRVVTRYRAHTLVRVSLESGRTHQIRVHMAHVHYPVVGDPVYGGRLKLPAGCSDALAAALRGFRRQALHATRLGLIHPVTGEELSWARPMPEDMQTLVDELARDVQQHARDDEHA